MPSIPATHECRVLIVEDNYDAANALAIALTRKDYSVETTRNGTEALTVASIFLPHIVILDIGLPGLDGLYVARQLRRTMPALLLISATGRSTPAVLEQSLEAGCDYHLLKPLEFAQVTTLLEQWVSLRGCEPRVDGVAN